MCCQNENNEKLDYLHSQLITYIGNKRALLDFIGEGVEIVQKKLSKEKLNCLDLFGGSGIISRYLKQFSNSLVVNDLENYSCVINRCYLANKSALDLEELENIYSRLLATIDEKMAALERDKKNNKYEAPGFISRLYSPADTENVKAAERCFYTTYNANYLDIARQTINEIVPEKYKDFFIAPLLSEASIHANTAGIFKGFYKNSKTGVGQFGGNGKNALSRIMGKIQLPFPIFSDYECKYKVFNEDANSLVLNDDLYCFCGETGKKMAGGEKVEEMAFGETGDGGEIGEIGETGDGGECCNNDEDIKEFDLAYLDPPYNQHPYGSNYFMLNLIADYKAHDETKISRVSGIPKNWKRSFYNKKKLVADVFYQLIKNLKAKYILISFNSEGFIPKDEMIKILSECGNVQVLESKYNTFRGSRNLGAREIHVKEYLFLLEKNHN